MRARKWPHFGIRFRIDAAIFVERRLNGLPLALVAWHREIMIALWRWLIASIGLRERNDRRRRLLNVNLKIFCSFSKSKFLLILIFGRENLNSHDTNRRAERALYNRLATRYS